jgi:hypothetical protein
MFTGVGHRGKPTVLRDTKQREKKKEGGGERERESVLSFFGQLVEVIGKLMAKFNQFGFLIKIENFLII